MTDRVLVVGGGVIGLTCSWRLAGAGHRVTLVAPTPGRDGASWVAAGMLAPVTEVQFGEAPLTELLLEGARCWKEFAASLEEASGHDIGYDPSGTLTVALDTSDRAALDHLLAYQHSLGCTAHRRTASECRTLVPSLTPTLRGGIEVPGDHHVDNRALLGALVAACRAGGVEFVPRAALALDPGSPGPTAVLSDGSRLGSDVVLLAAGTGTAHIGGLESAGLPTIRPVKGHILRLGPAPGAPLLGRTVARAGARPLHLPRPPARRDPGGRGDHGGARRRHRGAGRGGARAAQRRPGRGPGDRRARARCEAQTGLRPATADNTPVVGWTRPAGSGRGHRPLPQRHPAGAAARRPAVVDLLSAAGGR